MGPHFGHVKYIPSIIFRLRGVHDLDVNFPNGIVTAFDGLEEILNEKIRVVARDFVRFLPGHIFDPQSCEDVDLDVLERSILLS